MLSSTTGMGLRVYKMLGLSSALVGAVVLSGCAYAPGMYVGKASAGGEEAKSSNPWSITAARGEPDSTPSRADQPPAGALIAITPELIRAQQASGAQVSADIKRFFGSAQQYLIAPGDVVNVVVWDHPELTMQPAGSISDTGGATQLGSIVGNGYNVNPQGLIQFPYVGTVKIGGMSEFEARDVLVKRLSKYFKDPQVTVRVQSYRSGRIYVDGEVRTPGLQSINDVPMTLPEVIGRAGGLGTLADRSAIAVTRDGATTLIDMNQLVEKGINPNTILLKGGDLVRVMSREDSKVFVLGEVLKPSTQMLRHGRLSLSEALGDAGGVSPVSGDPRQIFVVRAGGKAEKPEIYHLDASTPAAYALAEGFQLRSRDVVYVDPVPLVRWNRVISLILPSAQTLYTTRNTLN